MFKDRGILWRLTGINILLITLLVLLSSLVIYNTACFLVEQMPNVDEVKQTTFNESLATYLLWISPLFILAGSLLHFSITKRLLKPVQQLVRSTKVLQHGNYPAPMKVDGKDEIAELTYNFNKLTELLKKNEHARNKMITDMAHELRTPLSTINGYLEGLKNGVLHGTPKLFESLHGESERLIQMINQLNELNEWNYGLKNQAYAHERIEIHHLLTNAINLFKFELDKKHILYELQLDEAVLLAEEKGIQQAVINLIQNAIQYYKSDTEEVILIKGKLKGDQYVVSITGPGEVIPDEQREWLFERFYKVDHARTRQAGGTGLGLAIVKEIITKLHGGEVGVETKGNLHTFWFSIPMNDMNR
ncbi:MULTISPECIES: HAMP domain-containing sensor histidine kinase [Bacillaceae]|uniref:histidine kinase n=1 Tax=Evansella alkalicola TaxID=745819 RepID=A0ABS6JWJ5_9BACI|nr:MULTISPECIES: HAMP domain-containing sensor histidine kinase [Bacillaceae]MBU9722602.1 HAMP domain-containing histidine kinase [Bacillus alkalicola]